MCDCAWTVHHGISCGEEGCHCHDIVDLDKWAPGEDVDADALVKAELLRYREIDSMKEVTVLAEADRNARAYGFEIGRGLPLEAVATQLSEDNPFIDLNWRDKLIRDSSSPKRAFKVYCSHINTKTFNTPSPHIKCLDCGKFMGTGAIGDF